MADSIYTNYPPTLSPAQQEYLVTTTKDWAIQNGLAVRPAPTALPEGADSNRVLATNAPVTLFPSPFPKACFEEAQALQTVYNQLYAAITCNEEWLGKVIGELIDVDDFVANLWKTHLAVKKEGYVQNLSLGLYRSDYMAHVTPNHAPTLKQVEFNTISSSFGGLSALVRSLHTELLTSPAGTPISYPPHPLLQSGVPPENTSVETLAGGLATAHKAYGPSKSTPELPLCVVFIVQDGERNVFDQHALSKRLTGFHKIPVFRVPSSKIFDQTSVSTSDPSRPLIYHPPHSPSTAFEVTTVYLRAYYSPDEYTSSRDWDARVHLERSAAIKCPTVLNQLAGCKKVQQVLAEPTGPDHLSSFLKGTDPALIARLRETFAPQYDLSANGQGRDLALNPETAMKHVLKPQREGGGNNIYKAEIPGFLQSLPESDWKGWVLMELINPAPDAENIALRNDGEVLRGNVISELGVYGTILWDNTGKVLHNDEGGWLLRTKGKEVNEGGVAAGFSSLDSVLLF
ncbi:glutathione synthetase [Penicillium ochrochloron]